MTSVVQIRPEQATDDFATFWQNYPRKVGKPLARAKFEAIINGGLKTRTLDKDSGQYVDIELHATAEEIIAGAKRYAKDQVDPVTFRLKDGGKYMLHPATFLNAGRWMDDT